MHKLAVRVCEHLRLRRDRVVVHWACKKITKACADGAAGEPGAPTDEELTRVITYNFALLKPNESKRNFLEMIYTYSEHLYVWNE